MNVLVIGSGGREHALCWKLAGEGCNVFCAPGNPGIAAVAEVQPISINDRRALLEWSQQIGADLILIGPEAPLISGLADMFRENGFPVFGPSMNAAKLEGSKGFSKDMMKRAGVPTARYQVFSDPVAALDFARELCANGQGVVVKASGAALGKGVVVCDGIEEAEASIRGMLQEGLHGEAGRSIVVEERLIGRELSLFTLVSGQNILTLPVAQDYKRIGEGDTGPNTGGMGSYSPVPWISDALIAQAEEEIVLPILKTLADLDTEYRGVLFSGIMVVDGNPMCLEYNVRFGDPETQTLMLRLDDGFAELLLACANGEPLDPVPVLNNAACTIIAASEGYPGDYEKGDRIEILELPRGSHLFHAGTAVTPVGLVTNGGRVFAASASAPTLSEARVIAYQAVDAVKFRGKTVRRDIAESVN